MGNRATRLPDRGLRSPRLKTSTRQVGASEQRAATSTEPGVRRRDLNVSGVNSKRERETRERNKI